MANDEKAVEAFSDDVGIVGSFETASFVNSTDDLGGVSAEN
jgi:hypothetical protein